MPKEQKSLDKNLPWAQTSPSSGTHPSGVRLSPPSVSRRFRLLEQLGVGGMGAVYRAYDRELGQELALKQLHSLSSRDRNHLKAEFRALAGIVHPNLVNLYELFVDEHVCFFTMELVRGVDFVQHAREAAAAGPADVAICNRVIDAARQLALALAALHDGGKLHRDVKPSNVLVTPAGRVVLVDFGLTAPLEGSADSNSVAEGFAGTVPYMAPEQVWGEKLGPAADWYAFGVTLFEALLGRLPLSGPPLEVALRKREFVAASLVAEGVPIVPAFDQLIVSLLDPQATRRPSASQVIACLGGDVGDRSRASAPPPGQSERFIVGREPELETLVRAFEAVSAGFTRVVHVTGSSGIGKSTLLREFQRRIEARDRALILRSRCHPQETVAFNAVDGLMDDLSRRLPRLPVSIVPALSEEQSASLLKIFPVLSQCGLGVPGDDRKLTVDGQSSRKNAITGLRELLTAVSRHRPLVLVLDDVQWADRDSGILLRELLRAPSDAALLVLLGYRAEDRASSACLGVLDAAALEDAAPPEPLTLALAPLDSDQSLELVERRLAQGRCDRALVEPLIVASGGSPFLLCEVANYLNSRNETAPEGLDLGAMLELRTRGLPPEARDVLEVLSVAGAPLGQAVALRAAGLGVDDRALITNLERLSIVRTTDAHERTTEVYHHRLRDEVLGQMTPADRVARHRSIASALVTSSTPNPLAAVHHLEAAADTDSLKRYIVSAAHHASQVLAFDRAAELYRRAIEIGASDVEAHELFRRLGTALANAGRGREAGEAFLSAAQALDRRSDTDPDYVLLLKQKASEQFIQSGHNDLGLRTLKEVLAGLDIHVPGTRRASINRATLLRVYSLFRGVKSKPMLADERSVDALRRFDALWAAGIRLSMIDHTFTSYSTIRCALDALSIGEPTRLVCALAGEAGNLAAVPNGVMQRRADALLASTDALLERESMPPYPRCFVRACRAVVAAFRGRHGETVELMDSAIQEFRAAAPGFTWETALWQVWLLNALGYVGNLSELRRRAASVLDEARLRDDRFMARSVALGRTTLAWLSEDRPEHTIEQADIALSWAPKEYTTQHYQHYISCAEAELYRGNVDGAWERTVREWPLLTENYFLMLTFLRDELLQIRARSALARARALDSNAGAQSADGASARSLRKLALESAGAIQDHGLESCRGWALLIRATVASQEGRKQASERALREAVAAFDESGMMLYREAARYRLGESLGDAGAEELARANAWLDEQGVVNRPAMIGMLAPGFTQSRS
jgi:serine/threonine protein kinase/tetratricopeptide (TPR) repeat protein